MSGVDFGAQRTPDYLIMLDNRDITSNFRSRLLSLTIEDKRDTEADTLSLVLDDSDGQIVMPQRGNLLRVFIGWQDSALLDKGSFVIIGVSHTGAPDQLTLTGFSTDLSDSLKESRSESWDSTTLGQVAQDIAQRNQLKVSLLPEIAAIEIGHVDQTHESDIQFITRLGQKYGTLATVKSGWLMLIKPGSGKTASGQPLPALTLFRRQGDKHTFAYQAETPYSGTRARWMQLDKARSGRVTVKGEIRGPGRFFMPLHERYLLLPTLYNTQDEATRAAQAEWEKKQRSSVTLTFTLALGRPDLIPETRVQVRGFKPLIDEQAWIVTHVSHSLSAAGGYISTVTLELDNAGALITVEPD